MSSNNTRQLLVRRESRKIHSTFKTHRDQLQVVREIFQLSTGFNVIIFSAARILVRKMNSVKNSVNKRKVYLVNVSFFNLNKIVDSCNFIIFNEIGIFFSLPWNVKKSFLARATSTPRWVGGKGCLHSLSREHSNKHRNEFFMSFRVFWDSQQRGGCDGFWISVELLRAFNQALTMLPLAVICVEFTGK